MTVYTAVPAQKLTLTRVQYHNSCQLSTIKKFAAPIVVWKQVIKGSSVLGFKGKTLIPSGAEHRMYSLTSFKTGLFGSVPFKKASKQIIIHINVLIYRPAWKSSAASRLDLISKPSQMWAIQSLQTDQEPNDTSSVQGHDNLKTLKHKHFHLTFSINWK